MSEWPPDLYRLEVLEYYLQQQLAAVRSEIAKLRDAEQRSPDPTDPRQPRGGQQSRPPQPDDPWTGGLTPTPRPDPGYGQPASYTLKWWRLQPATSTADEGRQPAILHRGDCVGAARYPQLDRREALVALGEPYVQACPRCRPDTGLR